MTKKTVQTIIKDSDCICLHPPFYFKDYESTEIGTDLTNSRYGTVSIKKCLKCNKLWLHYLVEYEAFSRSGRWFRGLITEKEIERITPENAINFLEKLDWYFYGGSYFETTERIGKGEIVDL